MLPGNIHRMLDETLYSRWPLAVTMFGLATCATMFSIHAIQLWVTGIVSCSDCILKTNLFLFIWFKPNTGTYQSIITQSTWKLQSAKLSKSTVPVRLFGSCDRRGWIVFRWPATLGIVCHSIGCSATLQLMIANSRYNDLVKPFISLGPFFYANNLRSIPMNLVASAEPIIRFGHDKNNRLFDLHNLPETI